MYLLASQEGFSDHMNGLKKFVECGLKNFESETFLWGRIYLRERINFRQMLWMQTLCELFSLFCLFRGVGVGVVIRWYMVWFEIDRPFVSFVILAWHHSVPTQSVLKFTRSVWRYKWIGIFVAKIWWSTYSLYSIKLRNVSSPLLLYTAFSCLEIVMFSKLKDSALSPTKNPGQFSNLLLLEARKQSTTFQEIRLPLLFCLQVNI